MAVSQVRALFDGQWHTLTYDPETRRYVCDLIPAATSYYEPGGVFNVTVELTNDSGAVSTVDGSIFKGLLLDAYETTAPAVVIESPEAGAFVTVSRPEIVLTAVDEAGGSGVDPDTLVVSAANIGPLEGAAAREEIENGYRLRFVPAGPLPDGPITLSVSVRDRDGNTGAAAREIIIDTVPPELHIDRFPVVVDTETITLTGKAGDATTPPVSASVRHGQSNYMAWHRDGSAWSFEVPLVVGVNTVSITATDQAGWRTTETRRLVRVITDRTQADVDALNALLSRASQGLLTDAEWAELAQARSRGAYNCTDINRVGAALNLLNQGFARHNYDPVWAPSGLTVSGVWGRTMSAAYPETVRRIWSRLPEGGPKPPENLRHLTQDTANGLEAVLVRAAARVVVLDNLKGPRTNPAAVMAGECMSGEF